MKKETWLRNKIKCLLFLSGTVEIGEKKRKNVFKMLKLIDLIRKDKDK